MLYDLKQIRKLAEVGAETETIAYIMGMDASTFRFYCKADPEIEKAINSGRANMKVMLRDKQIEKARRGDSRMLIWLGKQAATARNL